MDFDVVSKLFPNVLTMLTQLLATGVIYVLYKKYLHEPVLNYLDARSQLVADELSSANDLKEEALAIKAQSEAEYKELYAEIAVIKEKLVADAHKEHERLLEASKKEVAQMKEQSAKALEAEKSQMYDELYANLLDVATTINERVLRDTNFHDEDMLKALQKEIEHNDYQH